MRLIVLGALLLAAGLLVVRALPSLALLGWLLAAAGLALAAWRLVVGYRRPVQIEHEYDRGRRG